MTAAPQSNMFAYEFVVNQLKCMHSPVMKLIEIITYFLSYF